MSETSTFASPRARLITIASVFALLALALGFVVYSVVCPCERTPGGFLFGERVNEPISDWGFANSVPLCQLQIRAGIRPHSINLNCMTTPSGQMYLSCSQCETKYWAARVEEDEPAVMRLNGMTYPVVLNRVTEPSRMDSAWRARVAKLQSFGGAPPNPRPDPNAQRPEHWWTFHVQSRS